jgi:hypothetical protein
MLAPLQFISPATCMFLIRHRSLTINQRAGCALRVDTTVHDGDVTTLLPMVVQCLSQTFDVTSIPGALQFLCRAASSCVLPLLRLLLAGTNRKWPARWIVFSAMAVSLSATCVLHTLGEAWGTDSGTSVLPFPYPLVHCTTTVTTTTNTTIVLLSALLPKMGHGSRHVRRLQCCCSSFWSPAMVKDPDVS